MTRPAWRVLHVTDVTGGGVVSAISQYVRSTPELSHHVLAPAEALALLDNQVAGTAFPSGANPLAKGRLVRSASAFFLPDIIHVHSSWSGAYVRILAHEVPIVYQPHAIAYAGYGTSSVARAAYFGAEYALARRTRLLLSLSENEERMLGRLRSKVPIRRILNRSSLEPRQHETWMGSAQPRFAMAGRISHQKDPGFFGETASHIRTMLPDAQFVWIGDGDLDMRRQLESAGVRVTGWLDADSVATELAKCSVYLHTARYEGFPISLLDAASVGAPIVIRDTPSMAGIHLERANGPERMAEIAVGIVGHEKRLGAALARSRQMRETHSVERQATVLREVYAEASE